MNSKSNDEQWSERPSNVVYQASSPDEVALVRWSEEVGLAVVKRDLVSLTLRTPTKHLSKFSILQMFPFTSETKRMGILVKVSRLCKDENYRLANFQEDCKNVLWQMLPKIGNFRAFEVIHV